MINSVDARKLNEYISYNLSNVEKDMILENMRNMGFRITKQRKLIIDIILNNECSCCKDIYYKVSKLDKTIGIATVYRVVNTLEKIGVIDKNRMLKVKYDEEDLDTIGCVIEFDNGSTCRMSHVQLIDIIKCGLSHSLYGVGKSIHHIGLTREE